MEVTKSCDMISQAVQCLVEENEITHGSA